MWVNVEDKLPEEEVFVLVEYNGIATMAYITDSNRWIVLMNMKYEDPIDYDYDVKKWMHLPSLH